MFSHSRIPMTYDAAIEQDEAIELLQASGQVTDEEITEMENMPPLRFSDEPANAHHVRLWQLLFLSQIESLTNSLH